MRSGRTRQALYKEGTGSGLRPSFLTLFQPREYLRPSSVEEASSLLLQHGDGARIIGGGTQIYELAERGLLSETSALVDLGRLRLDRVSEVGGDMQIGASVTLQQLEENEDVQTRPELGAVLDALRCIHPVQVKNLATVGGAVCSSISFFDLPVALAALSASAEVSGEGGSRRSISVSDLMRDFLTTDLRPGEFVTRFVVEASPGISTSAFSKFSLTGNDWAIVNCGCSLGLEGGTIARAVLTFGGVSGIVQRARGTEERLVGESAKSGGRDGFAAAIDALDDDLKDAVSDYRASGSYRQRLAKVLLREALDRALARTGSPENAGGGGRP